MEKTVRSWTLGELASQLGGELSGPDDLRIEAPAVAGAGGGRHLTFAEDSRHLSLAEESEVGAIIVQRGLVTVKPSIIVDNPKRAFGEFLDLYRRQLPLEAGIHPTAVVSKNSTVDPAASIGPYVVVEEGATIGAQCKIYPFCYVGEGCNLHESVVLYPHVVLYQDVEIGARSIVHSGTVLGADGFGYDWDGVRQAKVPQVGGVTIGPDCEIGALTAIDRAMMGTTLLGEDTKIDNFVQIAHNCIIGDHTVIAAQTGIGGSTTVGDHVTMGGQVGLADHINIGDGISIAARSASTKDTSEPGLYHGHPMIPIQASHRLTALIQKLPDLARTVRELERRLAELESAGE